MVLEIRLMDDWISHSNKETFDNNGQFAASGLVISQLLEKMLNDPYFQSPAPKSTGSDYFNLQWLEKHLTGFEHEPAEKHQPPSHTWQRRPLQNRLKQNTDHCDEVLVCGGGAHNAFLMQLIQQQLPGIRLSSTENFGIHPDWVEAMAFAWLARRTLSVSLATLPA